LGCHRSTRPAPPCVVAADSFSGQRHSRRKLDFRSGKDLFRSAKDTGFEGIVAKRKASTYQPGQHSKDWLKIKSRRQQESVVGGFTAGKGSAQRTFGNLLLGAYRNGRLRYFGHSGTGFEQLRQTTFLGWRDDKKPKEVVLERPNC